MNKFDDNALRRIDALLGVIAEADKFGASGGELSLEDLDKVTGGVNWPNFQQFLKYARERDANANINM